MRMKDVNLMWLEKGSQLKDSKMKGGRKVLLTDVF